MTCPSSEQIARLLAEDLPLAEARALEQHIDGCSACAERRERARQLVATVAAPVAGVEQSADRFVAETMARIRSTPVHAAKRLPTRLLAVAAIVLVAAPVGFLIGRQLNQRAGSYTARGRTLDREFDLAAVAGVEPLKVVGRDAVLLGQGAKLTAGDRLGLRYTNLADEPLFLLAFAIDGRGEVHWLYPAYLDEKTDPEAVRLPPRVRQRSMLEVVQLQDVPSGPLRLVTVVGRRPMRVKQVERLVQGHRGPLGPLFPGAATEQWQLRMEVADGPR